jgi:Bacterial regulatory proteins, tetR family
MQRPVSQRGAVETAGDDRRVRRTRQALRQALIALIGEKGYAAVTVKDILARADVGRSTFYAHFPDKDALLLSGAQSLRAALPGLAHAGPGEWLPFSLALFEHAGEHRSVYRAIAGRRGGAMVMEYMRRALVQRVQSDLADGATVAPVVDLDAATQAVVGAFFAVLAWWLEHNPRLTAARVDAVFRGLTVPGLVATLGEAARPAR